MSEPRERKYP